MAESPIYALMTGDLPISPDVVHVDAHELHQQLGATVPFDTWVTAHIRGLGLVEDDDYVPARTHVVESSNAPYRGVLVCGYRLRTEVAKAICVREGSPQGLALWRRFVETERDMVGTLVATVVGLRAAAR